MEATPDSTLNPTRMLNPSGKVKVRKRRSKPSFFLIIALVLVVSTLRSTRGGPVSHEGSGGASGGGNGPKSKSTGAGNSNSGTVALEPESKLKHPQTEEEFNGNKVSRTEGYEEVSGTEKENEATSEGSMSTHFHHGTTTTAPDDVTSTSSETPHHHHSNETNTTDSPAGPCTRPAIEQFPRPWMSQAVRKNGGFLFYIFTTAYIFLALAIVCDEFFVPSLDLMCDVMKISPDVAGATFMAAGSSAPELATALIGVFVAKDDIGVSGVIGSAVFNIMFVISICALLTPTVLYLNWWPMVRDCFFYMISILALLGTIYDEEIEWYESIVLLLLYLVYCYVMYINEILEAWAHTLPISFPIHTVVEDENSHLVTYKQVPGGDANSAQLATGTTAPADNQIGMDSNLTWDGQQSMDYMGAASENNRVSSSTSTTGTTAAAASATATGMEPPKKVVPQPESILAQFDPPADHGLKKILWRISLPLIYLFYYTVPDCRIDTWKSWYLVTFIFSMLWIAIFSYFMVWMITVIGFTVGIPDTVMGLTFVAAGVSVPDALSSLAVIKEGFGDMAVSNAVGSNVFDILVCLGLPWFLSTVIVHPGEPVRVISKGLTYSTFSLLSTVAFLLIATHYNGWKLDKKYGVMLMLWYIFFMVFASLYELNVFGDFNPPECDSEY